MEQIGPWLLESELARGGMGVVWRARRVHDGAVAALKTLAQTDARVREAFGREVRALARVRHPGVVPILDHGEHEGRPWLAMELIEGEPLRSHSALNSVNTSSGSQRTWVTAMVEDAAPVPAAEARPTWTDDTLAPGLRLFRQVCSALAGLHAAGLVHRDLKPDNALVRPDGTVVLVDLGLASSRRAGRETVDVGELLAGTVAYMAPEQARGEVADARADLYALGCMLHEWLTGAPPFTGAPSAVVHGHRFVDPTPPGELADGVPPGVDALVHRLLQKDPRERLGRVDAVSRELEALGAPAIAGDATPPLLFRPGLVGRKPELELLRTALDELVRGTGRRIALRAPSGTGKTRLALELAALARRRGISVLSGECPPGVVHTFGPLQAVLDTVADRVRPDPAAFEAAVPGAALLGVAHPELGGLLQTASLGAGPDPDALRRALDLAVGQLCAERPQLVLIDDVQWADGATADWVARAALDRPLLLLLTARPEAELPADCTVIDLEPLQAADASEVAADVLGLRHVPAEIAKAAAAATPFHITEWLAAAVELGALVPEAGGGWRVADAAELQALAHQPTETLIEGRLERLGPALRPYAEAAAVLGRQVDPHTLAQMVQTTLPQALDATSELLRHWVLVDTPRGPRFAHDRLRERALGGLAPHELQTLHERAVEVLHDAEPAVRATHLQGAGRLEDAAAAWLEAAQRACDAWAWADASDHYDRGLAVGTEAQRLEIRTYRLQSHSGLTDAIALELEAMEVLAEARRIGRPELVIRGLVGAVYHAQSPANRSLGPDRAREAIALAKERELPALESHGWGALARVLYQAGRPEDAVEPARQAVAANERAGGAPHIGSSMLGLALRESGRVEEARELFEAVLPQWRVSHSNGLAGLLNSLAGVYLYLGDVSRAESVLREAAGLHERAGTTRQLGFSLNDLGQAALCRGAPDEALNLALRAEALFEANGDRTNRVWCSDTRIDAMVRLGLPEAEAESRKVLEEARALSLPLAVATSHIQLAEIALARGDLAQARAEVELASAHTGSGSHASLGARIRVLSASIALSEGDPERALADADQAVVATVNIPVALCDSLLERARARVATGDPTGAASDLDQAEGIYRQMGNRRRLGELRQVRRQLS